MPASASPSSRLRGEPLFVLSLIFPEVLVSVVVAGVGSAGEGAVFSILLSAATGGKLCSVAGGVLCSDKGGGALAVGATSLLFPHADAAMQPKPKRTLTVSYHLL